MKNTNRLVFAFLAAVALIFAAGCSDDSDSDGDTITASDLAGTTWTASQYATTTTLKFESGGKVTVSRYSLDGDFEESYSSSVSYSVSGSTVTLYDEDGSMELTYSSGQLLYSEDGEVYMTFTKVS